MRFDCKLSEGWNMSARVYVVACADSSHYAFMVLITDLVIDLPLENYKSSLIILLSIECMHVCVSLS